MKDRAASMAGEAKQEALGLAQAAKDKARSLAEERKAAGAEAISHVARAVHDAASELEQQSPVVARYVHEAASGIDRVAHSIRDRSLDDMVGMADDFARRNPGLFFGGAVVAGFTLARFLKSSSERRTHTRELYRAGAQHTRYSADEHRSRTGYATGTASAGVAGAGVTGSAVGTGVGGATTGVGAGTAGAGMGAGAAGAAARSGGVQSTRAGLGESAYRDRSSAGSVLGDTEQAGQGTAASGSKGAGQETASGQSTGGTSPRVG